MLHTGNNPVHGDRAEPSHVSQSSTSLSTSAIDLAATRELPPVRHLLSPSQSDPGQHQDSSAASNRVAHWARVGLSGLAAGIGLAAGLSAYLAF